MPSATAVELTAEEQEKLRKAKDKLSQKAYRERLREQRGVTTYAQRQAKRRTMKEAAEKKRADAAQARQARAERHKRAIELWAAGMPKTQVAVELGVSLGAVSTWLKGMTRPEPDPAPDPVDQALDEASSEVVADLRLAARDEEEQALAQQAEAHDGPADKYQAYVASMGIRMLRDNIKMVRGPRTIRELDALDQLIRRSLGLNSKTGGSGGRLNIDISILNNTKASSGAIGRVVLEAEEA
jgi:transposase